MAQNRYFSKGLGDAHTAIGPRFTREDGAVCEEVRETYRVDGVAKTEVYVRVVQVGAAEDALAEAERLMDEAGAGEELHKTFVRGTQARRAQFRTGEAVARVPESDGGALREEEWARRREDIKKKLLALKELYKGGHVDKRAYEQRRARLNDEFQALKARRAAAGKERKQEPRPESPRRPQQQTKATAPPVPKRKQNKRSKEPKGPLNGDAIHTSGALKGPSTWHGDKWK